MKKLILLSIISGLSVAACAVQGGSPEKSAIRVYKAQNAASLGNLDDYFIFTEAAEVSNKTEELSMLWNEMTHQGGTRSFKITQSSNIQENRVSLQYSADFADGNVEEGRLELKKTDNKWKIIID